MEINDYAQSSVVVGNSKLLQLSHLGDVVE